MPCYHRGVRPRVDPALFWFLATLAGLGFGCWWIVANIEQAERVQAVAGMLGVAALAFMAGTTSFTRTHH